MVLIDSPFDCVLQSNNVNGIYLKPQFPWMAIPLRFEMLVKVTRIVAETKRGQ